METDIWQAYQDQGLIVVAISSSTIGPEDPVALADYVATMGLTMPVLLDVDEAVYNDYRITTGDHFAPYPREYIIDRDGLLLYAEPTIDVAAMPPIIEAALAAN